MTMIQGRSGGSAVTNPGDPGVPTGQRVHVRGHRRDSARPKENTHGNIPAPDPGGSRWTHTALGNGLDRSPPTVAGQVARATAGSIPPVSSVRTGTGSPRVCRGLSPLGRFAWYVRYFGRPRPARDDLIAGAPRWAGPG
jgi:hypothetical protein